MTETSQYNPSEIEPKWQKRWDVDGLYHSNIDPSRPKHYALTMLPYPSGDLHIGHWYAMTPSDARARYMRMRGYNVLFPMGFDAFGLPAENAAIKRGIHPYTWTMANIDRNSDRDRISSVGRIFGMRLSRNGVLNSVQKIVLDPCRESSLNPKFNGCGSSTPPKGQARKPRKQRGTSCLCPGQLLPDKDRQLEQDDFTWSVKAARRLDGHKPRERLVPW